VTKVERKLTICVREIQIFYVLKSDLTRLLTQFEIQVYAAANDVR